MIGHRLRAGLAILEPPALRLRGGRCPFCGATVFVRLNQRDDGVRCLRCGAGRIHLTLGFALRALVADVAARDACEFAARGPVVDWLRHHARSLATSEYFADAPSGSLRGGVRCEDMQHLSYADASFDLVTHTEVLEHVPDDRRALRELRRVLRPGGVMLFSVPLHDGATTVERAQLDAVGQVRHLLPAVYHRDPQRPAGILAFRDYGRDLLKRVCTAGFDAVDWHAVDGVPWSPPLRVVRARVAG